MHASLSSDVAVASCDEVTMSGLVASFLLLSLQGARPKARAQVTECATCYFVVVFAILGPFIWVEALRSNHSNGGCLWTRPHERKPIFIGTACLDAIAYLTLTTKHTKRRGRVIPMRAYTETRLTLFLPAQPIFSRKLHALRSTSHKIIVQAPPTLIMCTFVVVGRFAFSSFSN